MGLERAAKQQGSQLVAALLKGAAAEEPRRGPKSSSSSYKGVTKHRRTGRWEAHIWGRTVLGGPGKQIYLGGFVTPEEAAEAHDIAAVQLQGANAKTNFHLSKYSGFLENRAEKGDLPAVLQLRRKASTAKRSSSTTPPARAALGVMPPPKVARRGPRLDSLGSPDSDSTQTGNEPGPSTPAAGRQFGYGGLEREDSITSRNGPQRPMPVRPSCLDQAATLRSPEGFGHSLNSSSLTDGPSAFHSPLPGLLPFHNRHSDQGTAQRAEEATVASGFPITEATESHASTSILLAQALLRSFGSSTLPAHILESLPDAAKALLSSLQHQAPDLPSPTGLPLRGFPIAQQGDLSPGAVLHPANELPSRPLNQSLWSHQTLSGAKRERDACHPQHGIGSQSEDSKPPCQPLRGEPLDMNTLQTIMAGTSAGRSAAQQSPWHDSPIKADAAPEQGFAPQDKFVFPKQPRSRPAHRSIVRQAVNGQKASHGDDMDTAEALLSLKRSV